MTYQQAYAQLYQIADADKDGVVGQQDGIAFFTLSGLNKETLVLKTDVPAGNIWAQANSQDTKHLSIAQFIMCCQLIALAQNGIAPSLVTLGQYLQQGKQIPLPTFRGTSPGMQSAPFQTNPQPEFGTNTASVTRNTTNLAPGRATFIPTNPGTSPIATNAAEEQDVVTSDMMAKSNQQFHALDANKNGFISGKEGFHFFKQSGISTEILATIWELADVSRDGKLDSKEFCLALYLVSSVLSGREILRPLPNTLLASIGLSPAATPTATQSSSSGISWEISTDERELDTDIFQQNSVSGAISFESAMILFNQSGLSNGELSIILNISDLNQDRSLSLSEFLCAMKLIRVRTSGKSIPSTIPQQLSESIQAQQARNLDPQAAVDIQLQQAKERISELVKENDRWKQRYREVEFLKDKAEARISQLITEIEQVRATTSVSLPPPKLVSTPTNNQPVIPSSDLDLSPPPSYEIKTSSLPLPPSAPLSVTTSVTSHPPISASPFNFSSTPKPTSLPQRTISPSSYSSGLPASKLPPKVKATPNPFLSGWEDDMLSPLPESANFKFASFTS